MICVGIVSASENNVENCSQIISSPSTDVTTFTPSVDLNHHNFLRDVSGLLIVGSLTEDVYDRSGIVGSFESACLDILRDALKLDMPVLAVGSGMLAINSVSGGGVATVITDDHAAAQGSELGYERHSIYVSPGSKLAAIMGTGGFFKVNSRHNMGLKEPQRSPSLLASAYSLSDGVIEGLESPNHSWVIGIQADIGFQNEVPKAFSNLFVAFVERSEKYFIDHGSDC